MSRSDTLTSGVFEADFDLSGTVSAPSVNGMLTARDLRASQISAPSLTGEITGYPIGSMLDLRIDAPVVVIADQTLNDVHAIAALSGTSIVLTELSANQPGMPGAITGHGTYDIDSGMYMVSLGGNDWRLVPTAEQPLSGRVNLTFEGSGTTTAPRGIGTLTVSDATWQETALGTVDAAVELDGQIAHINARVPEFDATATGRVELNAPYSAAVTLNAGRLDLARALQGIETPTPVTGTAGLAIRFDGPLETWRTGAGQLDITALDAMAGNLASASGQPGEGQVRARARLRRQSRGGRRRNAALGVGRPRRVRARAGRLGRARDADRRGRRGGACGRGDRTH